MISPENFTLLTIAIYLLASICGIGGMMARNGILRKLACWLALCAFFCQTLILVLGFHKLLPGGLTLGAYFQMLAWFFLLCGIGAWWRMRLDAILLFAAPLALLFFLMSAQWLQFTISLPTSLTASFYALHIGSLFLSLGLLALAFIAGVIFIFLSKRIKSKKRMNGFWDDLPALSLLDRINATCAIVAFPLYTIGIVVGLFWARPVFGTTLSGDPKEILSICIWMLLAVLFHNRLAKGWNGRKPALLAIIIFLLSIFSLLVINIFMPTHHAFIRA